MNNNDELTKIAIENIEKAIAEVKENRQDKIVIVSFITFVLGLVSGLFLALYIYK